MAKRNTAKARQNKEKVYDVRIVEDNTYSGKNIRNHIITLIIGTGLFLFFNITKGLIEGKTVLELFVSLGGEYIGFIGLSYIFYFVGLVFNRKK